MGESVKSTRFWKSKVITLFSAKSTDFHKAITLLLINVQKWFWYRWNCPLTFSADCRLSCTCDEHISKHIDIKKTHPHTHLHKCLTFSSSWRYRRLSHLGIESWNCVSGCRHNTWNRTHKQRTRRQKENKRKRQQKISFLGLRKELTQDCSNMFHFHENCPMGSFRWLCVEGIWISDKNH